MRLINESAGGFLVSTKYRRVIRVGQHMMLDTGVGCWEVEVVHREVDAGEQKIGLKRIREIEPEQDSRFPTMFLFLIAVFVTFFLAWYWISTKGWEFRPPW